MKYMAILWCGCLCKVNHIFSTLLLWNIVVYLSNFAWRVADMAAIFFTTLTILIIYDLGHCIYINICVFFKTLKISMCNILAMFFQGCLSYILCPHVDYFASLQNGIQSTHSRFWPERERWEAELIIMTSLTSCYQNMTTVLSTKTVFDTYIHMFQAVLFCHCLFFL